MSDNNSNKKDQMVKTDLLDNKQPEGKAPEAKPESNKPTDDKVATPKTTTDTSSTESSKKNTKKGSEDMSKTPQNNSTVTQPAEKPAKKGGLVAFLALLLGVGGTGLGAYNYNEARKLQPQDYSGEFSKLTEELKVATSKIAEMEKKNAALVKKQLDAQIGTISKAMKTEQNTVNTRLSKVEQMQAGLSKTLKGDLKTDLDKRLNEVSAMLNKVDQMELAQKGIAVNLQQVVAAKDAISAEGMAKRELGYLVRMADYKIRYEGDAVGATGLLEIAQTKLMLVNKGKVDPKFTAIKASIQQLKGVKSVDSSTVLNELKALSESVVALKIKKAAIAAEAKTSKEAPKNDIWGNMETLFITGGMKVIPGDPNNIDITAETGVYEKRFIQADLYTAELAVRSEDSELLATTIASVNTRLDKYFDNDDAAKKIRATLAKIKKQKLAVKLPDFSKLVELFNN